MKEAALSASFMGERTLLFAPENGRKAGIVFLKAPAGKDALIMLR